MLELRLFGTGQARFADKLLPGFPGHQPCLLLCYIVLNRQQAHPREQLASVFWGQHSTQTSLKRLRNTLWRVRKLLQSAGAAPDSYLLVGDDCVSFAPSGDYSLDVELFEATVARYQHLSGSELTPEQAVELERAVDLHAGDLLVGIYDDWCLVERERLNLLCLTTLSKLMSFHELNGTYEPGLSHGHRILAFDNTREAVHRQIMRLYWLMGDRSAALVQYRQCTQILRDTLQVPPMSETEHLYQQILHDGRANAAQASEHSSVSPLDTYNEATQMLVEQAVRSLHRLRSTLDQADAELRQISYVLDVLRKTPIDGISGTGRRSGDES